jgi:hypothetical protein
MVRSGGRARAYARARLSLGLALGALFILAARGDAVQLRAGDILINAEGSFSPTSLPRHEDAPITLRGGGRISTVSGELPPILETINIEFDRHGHVETTGLPVCRHSQLIATTVAAARRACGGAIVGRGYGSAVVKFPEQAPIPASSPITLFNGPRKHGNPTVFAHAYLTEPVGPATFIVPIEIERIQRGIYGYRTKARIPEIAGGAGHPTGGRLTVGRKWTHQGVRHSYVNARCETGRLQARGEFTFDDGTYLTGTFLRPCTVRR